jgi:hypothetical protein
MKMNLKPETQEIIKKIEWIVQNPPEFNEEKVVANMKRVYDFFGMNMPEIQAVQDMVTGYAITMNAAQDINWGGNWAQARSAAMGASYGITWNVALTASQSGARDLARSVAWVAAKAVTSLRVYHDGVRDVTWDAAQIACMLNKGLVNPKIKRFFEIEMEIFKALEHGLGFYFPMTDKLSRF